MSLGGFLLVLLGVELLGVALTLGLRALSADSIEQSISCPKCSEKKRFIRIKEAQQWVYGCLACGMRFTLDEQVNRRHVDWYRRYLRNRLGILDLGKEEKEELL